MIQDCGGIKAFLMRHDYIFVLGENHPNNPLVHLNKSGINHGKGEVSADPLILSMVNKVRSVHQKEQSDKMIMSLAHIVLFLSSR